MVKVLCTLYLSGGCASVALTVVSWMIFRVKSEHAVEELFLYAFGWPVLLAMFIIDLRKETSHKRRWVMKRALLVWVATFLIFIGCIWRYWS